MSVEPPADGWLDASTPLLAARALEIAVTMLCRGRPVIIVNITVPAPGVRRPLAQQVTAAGRYSQVASAIAGVSTGSALGRMMATRSMVLFDADSAVGGGLIDFHLDICATQEEESQGSSSVVVARSAVVSNIIVLAVVVSLLAAIALLWAVVARTSLMTAAGVSLIPLFIALVPSTASSATLLLARVSVSDDCAATDVLLGIVGFAVSILPVIGFLLPWGMFVIHHCSPSGSVTWRTVRRRGKQPTSVTLSNTRRLWHAVAHRRWGWTAVVVGVHRPAWAGMEHAWAC